MGRWAGGDGEYVINMRPVGSLKLVCCRLACCCIVCCSHTWCAARGLGTARVRYRCSERTIDQHSHLRAANCWTDDSINGASYPTKANSQASPRRPQSNRCLVNKSDTVRALLPLTQLALYLTLCYPSDDDLSLCKSCRCLYCTRWQLF